MNERHPTELLSAYLDGEVTTEERFEVARHLDACEACRALLDDFRTMASAAAQEPPAPAPAGLTARIAAALEAQAPKPRWGLFPWLPVPLAVAAGLLALVAATWVLLRREPERQPVAVAQAGPEGEPTEQAAPGDLARPRREMAPPVSKSESGQSDRPAAPPPPAAAGPPPKKDLEPALRSLGDLEPPRRKETAPESSAPAPGLLAPSKSESKIGPEAGEASGRVAAYGPARPEPGGRSIVFEFEGAKGTLTEAGLVTLERDRGACSADLSADPAAGEEVRSIFQLASAAPATRFVGLAEATKEAPRPGASGAAADTRVGTAAGGIARGAEGEAREKSADRPVKLIRVLSPTPRLLEAADVERVEQSLRRLLDVTARELLESRCGGPRPQPPPGD